MSTKSHPYKEKEINDLEAYLQKIEVSIKNFSEDFDIKDVSSQISEKYDLREKLFDEKKDLRDQITILKNGREINFLSGMETILENGDEISIFPPMHGG